MVVRSILFWLVLFWASGVGAAGNLTFQFTASPSNCASYILYQGSLSRVYTKTRNIGSPCNGSLCIYTWNNVSSGIKYFAVRCRDASKNVSDFSNEVSVIVP